jgi:uncharacterized protein YbcI
MPESQSDPVRPTGGHLVTAISNAVIRVLADHTGRGPTRARTVISGDWIFVTLEDALTKGERKLVSLGRREFVMHTRRAFQEAMRDEVVREIEALTGRKVLAFLSDNHFDPDLAVEALLLEPDSAPS